MTRCDKPAGLGAELEDLDLGQGQRRSSRKASCWESCFREASSRDRQMQLLEYSQKYPGGCRLVFGRRCERCSQGR